MATTKQGTVTKIYNLQTIGYDVIHSQFQQLAKDLDAVKKAKIAASTNLSTAGDSESVQQFSDELNKLIIREQELKVEREQLITQAKAAQIIRQQEIQSTKDQQKGITAQVGSYNELYQQYKQLYALVKAAPKGSAIEFGGNTLGFDQAVIKLQELATAEQNFRRQFAKDGLLVAEYTTGIVQAFKQANFGDIIGGQVQKAEQRINALNQDFEKLKTEFTEAKQTGVGDLNAIEAALIENRKEVVTLGSQVSNLKTELQGTGNVGTSITKAIGDGFKGLKNQVGGFILTFIGVQAVLSKLESFGEASSEEFSKLEISTARLKGSLQNLGRENELEGLTKSIDDLAAKFKFLNENDLREATDKLVVYGKLTKQQIDELLPVIVNFATRQRISLQDSTSVILKALEGNTRGLKEYGLNIKDAATEEGKFAIITEQLGQKVAGTAEQFDKSTTGGQARNREEWKRLEEQIGERVIPVLTSLGTIVVNLAAFLLNIPFPVVVAGLTAVTTAVALYKAEQIRAYLVTQIASKQGIIYNAYLVTQRIVTLAVAAATKVATFEITLFNGAIRISPIGIFLTLLGLIIPTVALFAEKLKTVRAEQSALSQVNKEASTIYVENISKIDTYIAIIKSAATSVDTKRKAVADLIATNKEFSNVIKNNVIDLNELDKAYGRVTEAITLQARTQASAQLTAQKKAAVDEIAFIRQTIETAVATGQKEIGDQLTKEQRVLIENLPAFKGQTKTQAQLKAAGVKTQSLGQNTFRGGEAFFDPTAVLADLKTEEDQRIALLESFQKVQDKTDADLKSFLDKQKGDVVATEVDIKALRDKVTALDQAIQDFKGSKADLAKKVAERDAAQKELDTLINKNQPAPRADRLSVNDQNALKQVDAARDELLAEENLKRAQDLEGEETFLQNILKINIDAIDSKLKLIKGGNAEEKKEVAQLKLERITDEQATNDKIFELRKNSAKQLLDQQIADIQFARDTVLRNPQLSETDRAQIKLDADNKILDLQLGFNKRIDELEKELAQRSITNAKESAEEIKKVREQIFNDTIEANLAALKDAQTAGQKSIDQFKALMSQLKLAIATDTDLDPAKRNKLQNIAQTQEDVGILAREVDSMQKQLPIYKELLKQKLITDQEYTEFSTQLTDKQIELQNALLKGITDGEAKIKKFYKELLDAGKISKDQYDKLIKEIDNDAAAGLKTVEGQVKSLKDLITTGINKLFHIHTSTAEGQALDKGLGEALAQSYALATTAMNNYYDAEQNRINQNLDLQLQRIDMEKQQVETRAQSQAEIDSIEKQYAAKEKAARKQAGEEIKKSKKSEAKIALAVQLMNVAVEASQYPFPASLIIGAILAGLAIANYSVQVAAINKETFAMGGQPGKKSSIVQRAWNGTKKIFGFGGKADEVPERGGKFGGRPHATGGTDFYFKGKTYNAEVDELAVIRTRNASRSKQYTVTGSQMQIASAANKIGGGHDFNPGAKVIRFDRGGFLGGALQAPVFVSSQSSGDPGAIIELKKISEKLDAQIQSSKQLAKEQSDRVDRLQTFVDSGDITKAQNKQLKRSTIGTL